MNNTNSTLIFAALLIDLLHFNVNHPAGAPILVISQYGSLIWALEPTQTQKEIRAILAERGEKFVLFDPMPLFCKIGETHETRWGWQTTGVQFIFARFDTRKDELHARCLPAPTRFMRFSDFAKERHRTQTKRIFRRVPLKSSRIFFLCLSWF